ncbi:hypothetical protein Gogos_018567 [Gossypium gossypioides]|uniref:Uncharacterized protein n=1 Tax=Gossypium gossypioides TaxID=34282 RepID=A0A7J9BEJ2_GOSGO|nr:hypothetical protein [Gossypium gossypioides]
MFDLICVDKNILSELIGLVAVVGCRDITWLMSRHHMTGVMTLVADCFIGGFGVGVAASKLGVATSEAFHRLLSLD